MNPDEEFYNALLDCAQMGACDRWTVQAGYATGPELMENAGAAVARHVMKSFPGAAVFHVLCGPGNNGGDGYVAARILAESGIEVRLYALAPPKPGTDAEIAASRWHHETETLDGFSPINGNGVVIDAVFGAGFGGELPLPVSSALGRITAAGLPIVAIDVPSGLRGDTGIADFKFSCHSTVTFFRKKPGHLLGDGPDMCGPVQLVDIGVRADASVGQFPAAFENRPERWLHYWPGHDRAVHKYRRGHVAVFSGPQFQTGAARLSATAAARAGAGAVTLLGDSDALKMHAAHVTSIMLRECSVANRQDVLGSLNSCSVVVLGPGFGDMEGAREIAALVLQRKHAGAAANLVLDADGITAFSQAPEALFELVDREAEPDLVLTPHEGEFARLFPDLSGHSDMGKLEKAKAAANRAHAVIVYKGADTVIAAPATPKMNEGIAVINTNATPALATAGSGDVLAGIIASLMAQGMGVFDAACAAVWVHGEAGRAAGPVCIAEDLIASLPIVIGGLLDTMNTD